MVPAGERVSLTVPAAGGASLAASVEGEGPDLLLVHAGVADRRMWDPLVALVRDRFRVIAYDARGAGDTVSPPGSFLPSSDLIAVAEAAEAREVTVVGASFGGFVALEASLVRPDLVARLVLLDAPLFDHDFAQELEDYDAAETAALQAGDFEEATRLNVETWAGRAEAPVRDLVYEMQRRRFELQREADLEFEELEPEVMERLGEIRAETIVAYGDRDHEDFIAIARRLAAEIPGATLHAIEGAGHLPALERPDAVAALL